MEALSIDTQARRKAGIMAALAADRFRPPRWLADGHAQTVWGPVVRRRIVPCPVFRRERWDTPDGDFLYVYFSEGDPDLPWVLLLHGLEGSHQSVYVSTCTHVLHGMGWNVAVMEYRTCSGELNSLPRTYHMGETGDLAFVVARFAELTESASLFLLGVSLGGNVVAKWLGESGDSVPSCICAAAAVSAPYNPALSGPVFHEVFGGLYTRRFLRSLIPKALAKARQFPGLLDEAAIRNCRTFTEFDTVVTAKLHGFDDAWDYWARVGCGQFLDGVRVPLLLLSAEDDPFHRVVPLPREAADASPFLHPLFTPNGGHVGWVDGPGVLGSAGWMERQVARFFTAYARA